MHNLNVFLQKLLSYEHFIKIFKSYLMHKMYGWAINTYQSIFSDVKGHWGKTKYTYLYF